MDRILRSRDQNAEAFWSSRRGFLVAMAGTGAIFGFSRPALAVFELPAAGATDVTPANAFEPTIWYSVDRSGLVTVSIIRAEMGQHVGTGPTGPR